MKNKLYFIIFILFIITFFIFLCFKNNPYSIRISLLFQNKSSKDIDSIWAQNFNRELLSVKGINEVFTVSSYDCCNIYIKLNPFLINKTKLISEIKIKIDSLINNINFYNENIFIDFDYEYNINPSHYLVFSFFEGDFEKFIEFENLFINEFLNNYSTSKISIFPTHPFSTYLYFDYETLRRFKLDVTRLRETIDSNNNNFNYFYKTLSNKSYGANISSDIDKINDIRNIVIPFVNNDFSIKLGDIIKIRNDLRFLNNSKIIYKNNDSIIFKLYKNRFCPDFIYEYRINKYLKNNISNSISAHKLINLKKYDKISLLLNNDTDFETLQKRISSNIKDDNSIYFLRMDNIKNFKNDIFEETDSDKFIILLNKKDKGKILKTLKDMNLTFSKNNKKMFIISDTLDNLDKKINKQKEMYKNYKITLTKKDTVILYKIDNYFLNDYDVSKNEVINSLIAHDEGLIIDYYLNSYHTIPIIIKNNQNNLSSYVYSKKDNILLNSNSFLDTELKNDYTQISRKNGEFCAILELY